MVRLDRWFAHHFKTTDEAFDFDICVPVSAPVTAVGRLRSWQRPAIKVLRDARHDFSLWVVADGHETADDLYECYLVGPESSPEPTDWRTELSRPAIE